VKVAKPIKVPILTRIVEVLQQPQFHVGAMLGFPIAEPRALLDEFAFWKVVGEALGSAVLDEGITKARGELLIAGDFHAPDGEPVDASFVRVKMGKIDKRLAVIGDRHWHRNVPTKPTPITTMPIDWAHAFGGPSFDKNPLGMGIELVERNGEKVRPLPNIEPYGALMRSPSEQPDPASLMGMDMSFAQRRNRAGTFGSDYVEKYAPGLPPDHEPTIYNAAAPDQWSDSVWRGDESFVVENMNATTQKLEGSLPGLRTRIFVTHRGRDGQRFVEIPLACDTVWLFPSVGLGAVVFHGSMPITQDDAADIVHLIACCEEPTSPRPIEHYQQALERRLDKDKAALAELSDRDLMPELSSGVAPNIAETDIGRWIRSEDIMGQNMRRGAELERQDRAAKLIEEGLDPKEFGVGEPIAIEQPQPPSDDLDALATYMEEAAERIEAEQAKAPDTKEDMEVKARAAFAEMGLDYDTESATAGEAGPPKFTAQGRLDELRQMGAEMRASGLDDSEIEQQLADPELRAQLVRQEAQVREAYRKAAHLLPTAEPMDEDMAQVARALVQAAIDSDESLAERDFTGADLRGVSLAGLDLSNAFLEAVNLAGCDLRGAKLQGAVLAKADLTGATLTGADLTHANLGRANLTETALDEADLTEAVLGMATLDRTRLQRAKLDGADLLQTSWNDVALSGASMKNITCLNVDFGASCLAGADLTKATFLECDLSDVDFSGAVLHKASFFKCKGDGARFAAATFNEGVMVHESTFAKARFDDAMLERTCFRGTDLQGAHFDGARMSWCDLSEACARDASFEQAQLMNALLIRTCLDGASLRGANLMDANVSKAELRGTDFAGAQLFRTDMTRTVGDAETSFADAVVKHVRIEPRAESAPSITSATEGDA